MIYECEQCEAVLGPGMMSCPRCGHLFDEPVPDDATPDEDETWAAPVPVAVETAPVSIKEETEPEEEIAPLLPPPLVLPVILPPVLPLAEPVVIQRPSRIRKNAWSLAAALALIGLGSAGYLFLPGLPAMPRLPFLNPAPTEILPAAATASRTAPTDLAAHPRYAANMTAFVRTLRATGVGAEWPAFGSTDTLLITPQTLVKGQRAERNADLYHELAQGIYANFVLDRYESQFSDNDSTTCFVIVSDSSGKVVAADFMGNLR